jgi:UDPglucose 6-dehydrogenase
VGLSNALLLAKHNKANFKTIPNALIKAIVESNKIRKEHITDSVVNKNLKVIGIYRLTMKTDSDNLRYSAIQEIISLIKSKSKDIEVLIYEPILANSLETDFLECKIISNLDVFKEKSELIISNRLTNELQDVSNITYTRDLFHNN